MKLGTIIRSLFVTAVLALSVACAPTMGSQQQYAGVNGRLDANHIWFSQDGRTVWTMLVNDRETNTWIVNFGGESKTLSRTLIESILSPGVLPAIISGRAGIRIAEEGSCGDGVCGTIIYNSGEAVAQSGSAANVNAVSGSSSSVNTATKPHLSSKSMSPLLLSRALGSQTILNQMQAHANGAKKPLTMQLATQGYDLGQQLLASIQ